MIRASIRDLKESRRPRYVEASRKEKSRILDELVAFTGYHRKSAVRALTRRSGVPIEEAPLSHQQTKGSTKEYIALPEAPPSFPYYASPNHPLSRDLIWPRVSRSRPPRLV